MCLNHFVESYDPTIEDSYRKQIILDGKPAVLEVLDTAGQEEYRNLRDQWIRQGDGFIIVYSITSEASFKRVKGFYDDIIHTMEAMIPPPTVCPPIVLVGNKSDQVMAREVSHQAGEARAKALGCDGFRETSAKSVSNVKEAFYDTARAIQKQRTATMSGAPAASPEWSPTRGYQEKGEKRRCTIL